MSIFQVGIIVAIALVGVLIGGVALFQNTAIYRFSAEPGTPGDYGLTEMEEVTFTNSDGAPLRAWIALPKGDAPSVISFYGNFTQFGPSVQHLTPLIQLGYGVAVMEYRGADGTGPAGEVGFAQDARAFYDQLDGLAGVLIPADRRIIHGFSLGSSIATHLAATRDASALVLESSFDSLCRFQTRRLRGVPMCWLMWRERHDVRDLIGDVDMPILIAHGAKDTSIPLDWAQALYNAAPDPKTFKVYEHGTHTTLFDLGLVDEIARFYADQTG